MPIDRHLTWRLYKGKKVNIGSDGWEPRIVQFDELCEHTRELELSIQRQAEYIRGMTPHILAMNLAIQKFYTSTENSSMEEMGKQFDSHLGTVAASAEKYHDSCSQLQLDIKNYQNNLRTLKRGVQERERKKAEVAQITSTIKRKQEKIEKVGQEKYQEVADRYDEIKKDFLQMDHHLSIEIDELLRFKTSEFDNRFRDLVESQRKFFATCLQSSEALLSTHTSLHQSCGDVSTDWQRLAAVKPEEIERSQRMKTMCSAANTARAASME